MVTCFKVEFIYLAFTRMPGMVTAGDSFSVGMSLVRVTSLSATDCFRSFFVAPMKNYRVGNLLEVSLCYLSLILSSPMFSHPYCERPHVASAMNGQKLEEETSFEYLGASPLCKDGTCSAEICIIRVASAMARLNRISFAS